MLRIETLTYRIAGRAILDGARASIDAGHRVGLVGRNGAGKTTLLRLIKGDLDPDGGAIAVPGRWRIGMTAQEAPDGPQNLIETVLAADRELAALRRAADTETDPERIAEIHIRLQDKGAHAAEARAGRLLSGLGFAHAAQQRACAEFSGGWRMRVALAALLFTEPDLLLLDEPTNHLDLEATLWLEDYLRRYAGTVVIVSHDRTLLNRAVQEILHLDGGKLSLYAGGYDRFEEARQRQMEQTAALRRRQLAERERIQGFVDRFRAKASKARQAQSRLKMLARLQPVAEMREEPTPPLSFPQPEALAPPLFSCDGVSLGYGTTTVLRNLSLRLDPGERIALLGANGNGKSTFVRFLAGRLQPQAGTVERSRKLVPGYFAQHQGDELDLAATPVQELARRRPRDREQQVRDQLGRFGFSQERAEIAIGNLSGGEKARLLFALMSRDRPNLLLLDEPTNHLDIAARERLVVALNDYEGAVVIVSHDPHLIELTADRLWLVADGGIAPFEGDIGDYRRRLLGSGEVGPAALPGPAAPSGKKERRRTAADAREKRGPLKKRLERSERTVREIAARKTEVERALADPALYRDAPERHVGLTREMARLSKDLAAAEDDWLRLQEDWERAAAE